MNNIFLNALYVLAQIGFDFYIFVLLLGVLFTFFNITFSNPIVHYFFKTNIFIKWLGKIIPVYHRIDFPAITFIFLLELAKIFSFYWLEFRVFPLSGWLFSFPFALVQLVSQLLNIWVIVLFIRIILQLGEISPQNPFFATLVGITEFMLKPLRRYIPNFKRLDLPAILMGCCLKFIDVVLLSPITEWSKIHLINALSSVGH